ncbi:hypothetical protein EVAR_73759_1 [Eumeta japonica]|uniref:Uncharacterized protein n=1 Tax=Eumeta variegata TaxID=151549 RepID=A0A4C1SUN1_EUMVA|nr:hypothetical protein EVAR_73759_1 [Eumeta japonica]
MMPSATICYNINENGNIMPVAADTTRTTIPLTAATNLTVNANETIYSQKPAGANAERLNGSANLESCESDGGCSSDSSADIKDSINLSLKQRRLSETSHHLTTEEDRDETQDNLRQRHELFEHFKML